MASLREHPPETVFKAQELYCVARLTYREVAAETGVAESSLKRWAAKYGWAEKRAAMAQAECDIRADLVLARSAMLKELIESKNAQVGFAVSSLESLALKQAEAERAGRMLTARQSAEGNRRRITTKEDAAQALQEAVETKLAAMLADPDQVDLAAVKNIKNALELIASIRPQTGEDHRAAQDKGISDDAAQQIIDKILGR
jgi:transposase-like protein